MSIERLFYVLKPFDDAIHFAHVCVSVLITNIDNYTESNEMNDVYVCVFVSIKHVWVCWLNIQIDETNENVFVEKFLCQFKFVKCEKKIMNSKQSIKIHTKCTLFQRGKKKFPQFLETNQVLFCSWPVSLHEFTLYSKHFYCRKLMYLLQGSLEYFCPCLEYSEYY